MLKNLKMNLQLFAEPGESGEAGEQGQGEEQVTFASQSELDSLVDKRISKALETAKTTWEQSASEKIEAAKQEAATEAVKLAEMDAEQKAKYQREQLDVELAKREAEITQRELKAQATVQLTEAKLPIELLTTLDYTNAETCKASIDAVSAAFTKATGSFDAAVQVEVDKRLSQSVDNPLGGGQTTRTDNPFSKESLNLTEQGRLFQTDPERARLLQQQAQQ
ncbi:DUF4355 domain-containing protein [Brochothrix thermosphacta]|uniref:DUF4355 domain-containing protein n=1 Tax=Brochothrix thermosphacta TaxID=2756 RepID=UPI00083F8C82|nr:DUF4355 domain-containing protein [Brochothrix thermosphacta]ODJ54800.1 hypothetical protein BFR41_06760 [Brochothrix thermosphacta]ODJ63248.1 hypothetical protein BFR35_01315 [Brochothrix thermosphacta]ODJ66952.1 hypothetical protein BFR37_07480 [Brochothrix thermosphacta]